jgi:hypothetical protein
MVDELLGQFSEDKLLGKNETFDSYAYAIRAVHCFKAEELKTDTAVFGIQTTLRATFTRVSASFPSILHRDGAKEQ